MKAEHPAIVGAGGAALAFRVACRAHECFRAAADWPPEIDDADLIVNATSERDDVLVELAEGQTLVDLPYPETATRGRGAGVRAEVDHGLEVLVAQGAASFELWTGVPAPVEVMRARRRLVRVTLRLATAGESHGPALVGILSGLPAGLELDRDAIDADLARRQQGLRAESAPEARAGPRSK